MTQPRETASILGIKGWDLSEYAISANAILGIRDSGKTYTATEVAEELFDAGVPWIALDPIGVWHSIRIPGTGKGYPVVVAGGRHADLPLTVKNAGAIVRAAMEAGVSLVVDLFSMELSKADWRRIVRETVEILLHENADYGLRHVFIEEAAEFVPQRVQDGQVFAAVEKLVRMGGNSKLGCTLINQRSADLNKSVLELCANVFVHRQTGKNTILDLKKWFEVMALDKAEQTKIADSLPDLKSGQCWAFINDLKKPLRIQVPAKNSQHPDRRAALVNAGDKRKPVAADSFVEAMKARLAPKAAVPAKLTNSIEKPPLLTSVPNIKAQERALLAAREEGANAVRETIPTMLDAQHQVSFRAGFEFLAARRAIFEPDMVPARKPLPAITAAMKAKPVAPAATSAFPKTAAQPKASTSPGGFQGPQKRVMESLAFWASVGTPTPTREQVAGIAGYAPTTGNYRAVVGSLVTAGQLVIPKPGHLALGDGAAIDPIERAEAKNRLLVVLDNPQQKIVNAALERDGAISRADLAEATNYEPTTGNFRAIVGSLCTLDIFVKPSDGHVAVSDWAREVLS